MAKEIRIELKVRNNLILTRMEEIGIGSVAELCRRAGVISSGDVGNLINLLADANPERDLQMKEVEATLEAGLGQLKSRERQVVELRYGLEDGREHTLDEVGKVIGVSRGRVGQIEARALRMLRHPSVSRRIIKSGLDDYIHRNEK